MTPQRPLGQRRFRSEKGRSHKCTLIRDPTDVVNDRAHQGPAAKPRPRWKERRASFKTKPSGYGWQKHGSTQRHPSTESKERERDLCVYLLHILRVYLLHVLCVSCLVFACVTCLLFACLAHRTDGQFCSLARCPTPSRFCLRSV